MRIILDGGDADRGRTATGFKNDIGMWIAHRSFAQPVPGEPTVITQIPLQTRGSHVVVDVTANGQEPFSFGLDTGASGSAWVTKALVERLSLPLVDHGSAYVLVDIGGVALEASIDSGNLGGVILPLALSDRVPLRAPPQRAGRVASVLNEFDLFRAELDGDLRVGDVLVSRPALFFSDLVQEPNIGRGVLRSLAVTFDQPNMRVQFSRPSANK